MSRPISTVEPVLRHAASVAVSQGYILSRHVLRSATQCDLLGAVLIARGSLSGRGAEGENAADLLGITTPEAKSLSAGWDGNVPTIVPECVDWALLGARLAKEYLGERSGK